MLHEPLDPGALLGHCGATSYGVSDCKGGSQGSFDLDFRHGPSSAILHRAVRSCLERCAHSAVATVVRELTRAQPEP